MSSDSESVSHVAFRAFDHLESLLHIPHFVICNCPFQVKRLQFFGFLSGVMQEKVEKVQIVEWVRSQNVDLFYESGSRAIMRLNETLITFHKRLCFHSSVADIRHSPEFELWLMANIWTNSVRDHLEPEISPWRNEENVGFISLDLSPRHF